MVFHTTRRRLRRRDRHMGAYSPPRYRRGGQGFAPRRPRRPFRVDRSHAVEPGHRQIPRRLPRGTGRTRVAGCPQNQSRKPDTHKTDIQQPAHLRPARRNTRGEDGFHHTRIHRSRKTPRSGRRPYRPRIRSAVSARYLRGLLERIARRADTQNPRQLRVVLESGTPR